MQRFAIIGLPRSGTTYLQTLLSSHPEIHCRGELFDPSQIDDAGKKVRNPDAIIARDADPCAFMDRMLAGEGMEQKPGLRLIGVKILFQHHPALLSEYLPARPEIKILHVRRENKLAQFASTAQVGKTRTWTSTRDMGPAPRIGADASWAASSCNRLQNEDFLLGSWLGSLQHRQKVLQYHRLFDPATIADVLAFLGLDRHAALRSPLVKQGQNRIIERFEHPEPIRAYFEGTGRGHWLGRELD